MGSSRAQREDARDLTLGALDARDVASAPRAAVRHYDARMGSIYGFGRGPLVGLSLAVGALALGALAAACSSPVQPAPPPPRPPPPPPPTVSVATPTATATASAAAEAPPPDPGPPFPPRDVTPPVERTKKEGDGVFTVFGPKGPGGAPLMARTIFHPHAIKPHPYVVVVAVDLRRVDLELVAGMDEPSSKTIPKERRTGLVPKQELSRLVAVFNGGFMTKHGKFGARIGQDAFVPPREDACTVGVRSADRGVVVAPWPEVAPDEAKLAFWRQTPVCMVDGGVLHPDLQDEKSRKWGGAENGDKEVRRSAIGVDATGKILFYGLGEWTTPKSIAVAMKTAGAADVAELDINYSYTFFMLYGPAQGGNGLEVSEPLVDKLKFSKRGHVEKPVHRDFFYLRTK